MKYMISQGADITSFNNYAIKTAARFHDFDLVDYLVSVGADITAGYHYAIKTVGRLHIGYRRSHQYAVKRIIRIVLDEMKKYTVLLLLNGMIISKDMLCKITLKKYRKHYGMYQRSWF